MTATTEITDAITISTEPAIAKFRLKAELVCSPIRRTSLVSRIRKKNTSGRIIAFTVCVVNLHLYTGLVKANASVSPFTGSALEV